MKGMRLLKKVYAKQHYIILYSEERDNYTVYNTKVEWERGHTHINTYKQAQYLIDCALNKKVPDKVNKYFLVSLTRIVTDKKHKEQIERKIENIQTKQHYVNKPKGFKW